MRMKALNALSNMGTGVRVPPKDAGNAGSRCDSYGNLTLRFVWPRSTRETDGIAAKLLRCGIASEALRRNMMNPNTGYRDKCSWHRANPTSPSFPFPPLPHCSFGISFGNRLPIVSSLLGPKQPNDSQMMRQKMFPGDGMEVM